MTTSPRRCVCPGSYDPVTNGHIDVIARAARLFDEVVVAILHNPAKHGTFTIDERLDLLGSAVGDLDNVRIEAFADVLVVDVCRQVGAASMVKGLRGGTDFAYELPMANMNHHLTGVETLFLVAAPEWQHVSSSLIKEVVRYGGDVTGLVPEPVNKALRDRVGRRAAHG
ncbi:phosphopantetheine adenylyltransferase [Intrasporangium chromatireducens Q5-1]|uniref:Phosphopantetheine adenylyltransferase n=1 Tax=Intrasporangium chromatireducens Q5-1 TaxID=584657 RepID=W9GJM3_9MICO|nr:pantetheine-phosphate adenylyltransferase [Intrasporangium chromatireducens]EWT05357.1 phosphopantetheine adenylyltransferase [Intrasporangium chromatireducens Q5-1]